jgi:hypothetical protein
MGGINESHTHTDTVTARTTLVYDRRGVKIDDVVGVVRDFDLKLHYIP